MAKVKDVICGMDVDPAKAKHSSEYGGTTSYFCNAWCKRAFDQDPPRYVAERGVR